MLENDVLLSLRKFLCPEIVYGPGALGLAGRHAQNFGATKVFIVTDTGVQKFGWTQKVELSLREFKIPYVVFNGVTPNPKDHEVMDGAEMYRREACDLILAVGGGSPMDCAKGVGVVIGNTEHILRFEGVDEIVHPGPPMIFIPTTAGTSADISQFAIVADSTRHVKIAIVSKMVIPDIALVDPETTVTMPPDLTAATGMDALCHAIEAFVSTAASPLSDMAARSSVQLIAESLLKAYQHPDDRVFRNQMMMASLMAGLAFSNASLGLVHAMAHSLGGTLDLPHGECNAVLLEEVIRFNHGEAAPKYADLATAMGISSRGENPAMDLADTVATLRERLGITQRLSDMGVSLMDIPRLADFASKDPCLSTNPRTATTEQIEAIYQKIH